MTKKESKCPLTVTVTPSPNPDYPSQAMVEATLELPEGKAVFTFEHGPITSKERAAAIAKALEERSIRNVKFDSETAGHLHMMWNGQADPVAFWVRAEGPEYIYSRAKAALKMCVSKGL